MTSENRLARALLGVSAPDKNLPATDGNPVNPARLEGCSIVYIYPRTSPPYGQPLEGWDDIPGARGCTPQNCAFRDHFDELKAAGADHVFGLSSQDTFYQSEMARRLHLPFPVISDAQLTLKSELMLPTFVVENHELYKRMTLILHDGKVRKVFYPVADPAKNALEVIEYLTARG